MVDSVNNADRAASLLRDVARRFVRSQRAAAACSGGRSEAQCHVLGELARGGPLRMTDLSARLGADKGWTSRAVSSMEADGLLVRTGQDGDGRAVTVSLTRAGAARWSAMDVALTRHSADVMARLPREDRALVERALELLNDALASEGERKGRGPSPSAPRRRARAPVARSGRRP